jgi:DNA-binding NtrC family response regulator
MTDPKPKIIVVDDERNIRLTISYALEDADCEIDTAVNGEEALQKLREQSYALMLLDLRMPGMDGIDVLRYVADQYPDMRVVIITAHGTVNNAVEAMKLGAIEFIQKPFTPQEIREVVADVLARESIERKPGLGYETHLDLAKRLIGARDLYAAMKETQAAIALDPSRAEAFNLLGAIHELNGDPSQAKKHYRVALDLDPTFALARDNLTRVSDRSRRFERPKLG